jgi:hypothetical protein
MLKDQDLRMKYMERQNVFIVQSRNKYELVGTSAFWNVCFKRDGSNFGLNC